MSDPTREELIEIGARALAEWHGDPPWDEIISQARKENYQLRTAAILDAILPRVLEGVVEALGPFEDLDCEGAEDHPDDTKVTTQYGRVTDYSLRLGDFRRARSVRQWAEKRISECPPSTTK